MGIHLNDHIDWWFLLPVDCYRQRCMRHVEHTPIERNVEEYGTFWQCMGAHFEGPRYHAPEGPRPSNCQPCFFLRSLSEDVDQLRIQNQNLRKRLVLKLHKCNCLEVRFEGTTCCDEIFAHIWRTRILEQQLCVSGEFYGVLKLCLVGACCFHQFHQGQMSSQSRQRLLKARLLHTMQSLRSSGISVICARWFLK